MQTKGKRLGIEVTISSFKKGSVYWYMCVKDEFEKLPREEIGQKGNKEQKGIATCSLVNTDM